MKKYKQNHYDIHNIYEQLHSGEAISPAGHEKAGWQKRRNNYYGIIPCPGQNLSSSLSASFSISFLRAMTLSHSSGIDSYP